jgi:dihydroneopterin aldolase
LQGEAADDPPLVVANPELLWISEEEQTGDEGCLSFPGIFVPVKRGQRARVRAQDVDGKSFEIEGEGLFARALQHENDHLTGRLLIDMVGRSSARSSSARCAKKTREKTRPKQPSFGSRFHRQAMPTLVLSRITFEGRHGATEHERRSLRTFEVDVEIDTALEQARKSDDLDDTIDYRTVAELIVELGTSETHHLLESLAGRLLDRAGREISFGYLPHRVAQAQSARLSRPSCLRGRAHEPQLKKAHGGQRRAQGDQSPSLPPTLPRMFFTLERACLSSSMRFLARRERRRFCRRMRSMSCTRWLSAPSFAVSILSASSLRAK